MIAMTSCKSGFRAVLSSPYFWLGVVALLLFFGAIDHAHAADATPGGTGLPWESPLQKLRASISGPVAFTIALLGIIAGGATLIWGGEISEFTRRIVYVVLVVCLIVFANSILTSSLFSGAVVPDGVRITAHDLAVAQLKHDPADDPARGLTRAGTAFGSR